MKTFTRRGQAAVSAPSPPRRGLGGSMSLTPGGQRLAEDVDPEDAPEGLPGSRRTWRRLRSRHLREDNPQATWTSGSRLGTRVGTIALLAAIELGHLAFPEAPPMVATSVQIFLGLGELEVARTVLSALPRRPVEHPLVIAARAAVAEAADAQLAAQLAEPLEGSPTS